jgi:hypothetical protein
MHVEPINSQGISKVISVSRLSLPITPTALAIRSVSPATHPVTEDDDFGDVKGDLRNVVMEIIVLEPKSVQKCTFTLTLYHPPMSLDTPVLSQVLGTVI